MAGTDDGSPPPTPPAGDTGSGSTPPPTPPSDGGTEASGSDDDNPLKAGKACLGSLKSKDSELKREFKALLERLQDLEGTEPPTQEEIDEIKDNLPDDPTLLKSMFGELLALLVAFQEEHAAESDDLIARSKAARGVE